MVNVGDNTKISDEVMLFDIFLHFIKVQDKYSYVYLFQYSKYGYSDIFKKTFYSFIPFGIVSLAFAEGKLFNKNYEGIQIQAVIITHEGKIVVDLNFKALQIRLRISWIWLKGFYKGLVFHRIIQDFMVQGGDPLGNGQGDPGYYIDDEANDLKHEVGVISMANRGPNTAGSQFFITLMPQHHLDGKHTVFGRVIQGQDVVCRIEPNDPIINIEIIEKK